MSRDGVYPPGVTGNEFAIAGPDYEKEWDDEPCPHCDGQLMELGYKHEHWLACLACDYIRDLEYDDEHDPDRAHDEAVERRMFGD